MPIEPEQIFIRTAVHADLAPLAKLERDYSTDHVWQLDVREVENLRTISFRQVRLPRVMQVTYPRHLAGLLAVGLQLPLFLIAEYSATVVGYLAVVYGTAPNSVLITDIVVERTLRRQGVGSQLLQAALAWAQRTGVRQIQIETQSKNYNAICFAVKHGFVFSGYNDHYYPNFDIAVFFGKQLR